MNAIKITKENFKEEILNSEKPVLVDFWATWCSPCRMLTPTIEELAVEQDKVKVCKINIDEERELAEQFRVMSIPTLVLLKGGQEVERMVGLRQKSVIEEMIKE